MSNVQRFTPHRETTLPIAERWERVLAYAIPIVSGLVLLAVEKNPTVRRHARQAVWVFTPIFLVWGVLGLLAALLGIIPVLNLLDYLLNPIQGLVWWIGAVIWVILMLMAFFLPDLVFFGDKKDDKKQQRS
jgi:uncharacterized membrane protein